MKPIIFLAGLLSLLACAKKQETREEYIRRTVAERVEKYRQRKTEICEKKLLDSATAIADSILIQEALALDTLQEKLPDVPPKPGFIEPAPQAPLPEVKPVLEGTDSL